MPDWRRTGGQYWINAQKVGLIIIFSIQHYLRVMKFDEKLILIFDLPIYQKTTHI